ncbi:HNH endonuclease signature motif containing protein [Sporichthya brevicatena]
MELSGLTGAECVAHAVQAQRALNVAAAARLAAVAEVAACAPGSGARVERMAEPDRYSIDEVRAMYSLSVPAAGALIDLAWTACRRLPELHAAMAAGDLDERRAATIVFWVKDLCDAHTHQICAEVLPHCGLSAEAPWVSGKLVAQIKKRAIALDPSWAERRYTDAVRRRRVVSWQNPDGTADLTGQQLEVDRVAAAKGRIHALADAAKRDGDPRGIDAIRADLYLGCLDGTWAGLSDADLLADYAKTRPAPPVDDPDTEPEGAPAPAAHVDDPLPAGVQAGLARSARSSPYIGVVLRAKFSTLLGFDEHPAELAGAGPISPASARRIAQRMALGTWRVAFIDDEGRLAHTGLVGPRPTGWAQPRGLLPKGVLDLLVPIDLLDQLALRAHLPDLPPVDPIWIPVIEHLHRSLGRQERIAEDRYWREWIERDEAERSGDPARLAEVIARQERARRRRFPTLTQRRRLQLAIPDCIGVACNRASHRAQIDHIHDHALGGPTVEDNLAPECGHDHALKTKGGWTLERIDEHRWCWTTRLGIHYPVTNPPLLDHYPEADQQRHRPRPDTDAA